jgi:hypothetical protein
MGIIRELIIKGRDAKTENAWTPKWEEGCKVFEKAYTDSDKLKVQLRTEIARADSIKREKESKKTQRIYLIIGIVATITVAIVFYLLGARQTPPPGFIFSY